MTTAIIGVGHIGSTLARYLVHGGELVILAAASESNAAALANELGPLATAAPVSQAISTADTVIFAVWLDTLKQLVTENRDWLNDKVVVDPTNPIKLDGNGAWVRSLPEGQSSGSVVAGLLPPGAHYVKAFGTLSATTLGASAHRLPRRVVLFYATDDAAGPPRRLSGSSRQPGLTR